MLLTMVMIKERVDGPSERSRSTEDAYQTTGRRQQRRRRDYKVARADNTIDVKSNPDEQLRPWCAMGEASVGVRKRERKSESESVE